VKRVALSTIVCLCLLSIPALSEESDTPKKKDLSVENVQILMEVENIQITFLVRDPEGNFIRNLSASDFVITENGREQNISLLREQEVPISAVVMMDTSWSTAQFIGNAAKVALDFFKNLQQEPTAFVTFSESAHKVMDWDEHPGDFGALTQNINPEGKTALYDSVIWVSRNMFQKRPGKKLIILLTDGIDTVSKASFQQMMQVTREHGITLYPIIYTNQYIENYRKSLRRPGPRANRSISSDFHNLILMQNRFIDQSLRYGGRTIFSNAFNDLHSIYGNIVTEMKSQYVMLYHSEPGQESDRRDVRVHTKRVPGKIFIEISR
jgi:Ca-activated chloride channel homolog